MSRLPDLADRIERLLLRHEEQKRTNALLEQQLRVVTDERDNLRSRLAAARARIDTLIDRLPAEAAAPGNERPQADDRRRPPPEGVVESPGKAGSTQEHPQADDRRRPPPEGVVESPGKAGSTQEAHPHAPSGSPQA